MTTNPAVRSIITLGVAACVAFGSVFFLFDWLLKLVGERAVGIVFSIVLVLVGGVLGCVLYLLPWRARMTLGLLGWTATAIMFIIRFR